MATDLSGAIYKLYQQALSDAKSFREKGNSKKAAENYFQAGQWMLNYSEYAGDKEIRTKRVERGNHLKKLANEINGTPKKEDIFQGENKIDSNFGEGNGNASDNYEEEVLSFIHKTDINWNEIGGLKNIKKDIKIAYAMALVNVPKGIKLSSWKNLLLFGPPGTGKTLLAAATASNLDATFFNVKVSNLLSKYFGESTKLISALYQIAKKLSPSVIFLDEFESLTPTRGTGESGAERRIISTLLAELDGLSSKSGNEFVLTMCATNMPWLLDIAVLSRFQRRIYVSLPDAEAREAIIDIHLFKRGFSSEIDIKELVNQTNKFAGREIEQLLRIAITNMVERNNPDLENLVDEGQMKIQNYSLNITELKNEDFEKGFLEVSPSTTDELLKKYDNWVRSS
jgi:katanin p60 ATPase-containing subunit A1